MPTAFVTALTCLAALAPPDFRTWESTAGSRVTAKLKTYTQGEVTLVLRNGREVKAPIGSLSVADNEWLENHLRQQRQTMLVSGLELALIKKDFARAKTAFENCARSETDFVDSATNATRSVVVCALNNLAVVAVRQQHAARALRYLERAFELAPEDEEVRQNLAHFHARTSRKSSGLRVNRTTARTIEKLRESYPASGNPPAAFAYLHPSGAILDPWCPRCGGSGLQDCPNSSCMRGGVRAYHTRVKGRGAHGEPIFERIPYRVKCGQCDGRGMVTCPECDGKEQRAPDVSFLQSQLKTESVETAESKAHPPSAAPNIVDQVREIKRLEQEQLTGLQKAVRIERLNSELADQRVSIDAVIRDIRQFGGKVTLEGEFQPPQPDPVVTPMVGKFTWTLNDGGETPSVKAGDVVELTGILRLELGRKAGSVVLCAVAGWGQVLLTDVSMKRQASSEASPPEKEETDQAVVADDVSHRAAPTPSQMPKGSGKAFMVRVVVNDATQTRPIHPRAEIWFRGHGSWWLERELDYGSTFKILGPRPSGTTQTLTIYPESRDGPELEVPFMMTDEMNPKGSPRDMIFVAISDEKITVQGLPITAATGKSELKYKR